MIAFKPIREIRRRASRPATLQDRSRDSFNYTPVAEALFDSEYVLTLPTVSITITKLPTHGEALQPAIVW